MKIKRTLDISNTTYELSELSRRQFSELFHCLEKQLYIYRNSQMPIDESPEIEYDDITAMYLKMRKMLEAEVLVI